MSVKEHDAALPGTNGAGSHTPLPTRSPQPARGSAAGPTTDDVFAQVVSSRRERLSDVLDGRANEFAADDLELAMRIDLALHQSDHARLIRAASLAIQYRRVDRAGSERAFFRRASAVLQVDARELEAYVLVLQREIRHRERTGSSPLADLPVLTGANELEEQPADEPLALASEGRPKRDPSEYVALAEQGLNNTEIAKQLGDVSEASVRRGLAAAGYSRSDQ
jgi:hypothetical protein